MAAISTTLELIPHGSHIIASDDLYGGTYRLFERVRRESAGLECSYIDTSNVANVERAGLGSLSEHQKISYELERGQNGKTSAVDLKAA